MQGNIFFLSIFILILLIEVFNTKMLLYHITHRRVFCWEKIYIISSLIDKL